MAAPARHLKRAARWVGGALAGLVAVVLLFVFVEIAQLIGRLARFLARQLSRVAPPRVSFVVVVLLLVSLGISLRVPALTARRAVLVGLFVAAQSYCLYSAVAIIPVALALLAFQTCPMVLALLSWATGGERPRPLSRIGGGGDRSRESEGSPIGEPA